MSSGHAGKYEVLVSAETAEEAIEIAAEGLPKGAELLKGEAEDVSARHGPESWYVRLAFKGGRRAASDLLE